MIGAGVEIEMLYPRFVFKKKWKIETGFNERLAKVAIEDAVANRVPPEGHDRAIGDRATHLAHLRHNFLEDKKDPVVAKFARMVDEGVREYLSMVYHYDHEGDINMMSDTFWQTRSEGQNVGINCHTHFRADLVVTYYVKTGIEPGEDNPLRKGAVRFYDPQILGVPNWPNKNPHFWRGGWYNVVPEEGMMVIFEGHIPHDSSFFGGDERLCIPVMCDVITPRVHKKASLSTILAKQGEVPDGLQD